VDEVATVEGEVVLEAGEAAIVVDEEDFQEAVVEVSFYIFAELNFQVISSLIAELFFHFPFRSETKSEQMWLTGG
jgi:hypothetical protein